jgi:amino acid adenylation domain-containing protein
MQEVQPVRFNCLKVVKLAQGDEDGLAQALQRDRTTPFDLEREPGWRVTLFRMGSDDHHVISIVMHHIISDGWSIHILWRELAAFYLAAIRNQNVPAQLDDLPIQYRDYALWQRQEDQMEHHEKQLQYWVTQLQASQPAELPRDKPRPAILPGSADSREMKIDGELYDKLQRFCKDKDRQVTPFIVLLSAFRAAHFRLTGQDDAMVGTPNANRDRWEVKDVIGFFVNIQCIRIPLKDQSFSELVQQVQMTVIDSFANQDVPFDQIVGKLQKNRDLSRHPLVQILFTVHSSLGLGELSLDGISSEAIPEILTTRFDLEFHVVPEKDGLRAEALFSTDLYKGETMENLLTVFRAVLEQGLHEPNTPIISLPLLDSKSYSRLSEMGLLSENRTDYPRDSSIIDVFRQQVALCPDKVAVKDESTQLTYAQLNRDSDRLAQWISSRSLPPETLVGIFSGRCCQALVAFLGVLKANLACLPLDIKLPPARIATILSSVNDNPLILLGPNVNPPALAPGTEFMSITNALMNAPDVPLGPGPSATSLAYVIFTSGSTGRPKGVMVEHRGIVRLLKQKKSLLHHNPADGTTAHITNLAFDLSLLEIYSALLNGGTLICIDAMTALDYQALARTFAQEVIRSMVVTPALLKQYILECPTALTTLDAIYVGGDKIDPQDVITAQRLIRGHFISACGPTEDTIFDTYHCVSPNEHFTNGVPIGRPVNDSGVYVMDQQQRLVPLGVIGEFVATGDGLARGYLDSRQNINRFIDIVIDGRLVKAYRSGDYGRCRPTDGVIEIMGRIDAQVKIRGHRVELGEIEHVLRSHKSVNAVAVVLQAQDVDRDPYLVGFVTLHKGIAEQQDQIQWQLDEMLRVQLPSYMVPRTIAVLEAMPLNVNGKIDRRALLAAAPKQQEISTRRALQQPTSEAERQMQKIWAKVLGVDEDTIGVGDSFFRIGGDSLATMKVVSEARRVNLSLSVADIFRHPSLRDVASHAVPTDVSSDNIIPHQLAGPVELSYAQGRLWFLEQLYPGLSWYLMPWTIRLRGSLSITALNKVILALEQRHETLRTTFSTRNGVSLQEVHPPRHKGVDVVDMPHDDQHLAQVLSSDRSKPFNLEKEPGWRVTIYRLGDQDHVLSLVLHHIIGDGWSVEVLCRELAILYAAMLQDDKQDHASHHQCVPLLKPLPVQYRDYSIWQRQQAQMLEHERQLEYWVGQLQTSQPAELLCDKSRPSALSGKAAEHDLRIEGAIYRSLQEFCKKYEVTPFIVLFAAFRATHFRLTGQHDATIGAPNANRDRWEVKDIIGFFVNMQSIRSKVEYDDSFAQLVQQVHGTVTDSFANQDVPFERIVAKLQKERDLSRHPLVQMVFVLHSQVNLGHFTLEGLDVEPIEQSVTSRFDVEFHLFQEPDALRGQVLFSTDLYMPETIQSMVSVFNCILKQGLETPDLAIASLPLSGLVVGDVSKTESLQLSRLNNYPISDYPRDSSIVEIFRQQVLQCPERVAVKDSGMQYTYTQLNHASDRLACWLLARRSQTPESLSSEALIGVYSDRSYQTIVAFLGVLKANMAYLPLDVKLPAGRLKSILSAIKGHHLILTGPNVQAPSFVLEDAEFVPIAKAIEASNSDAESLTPPATPPDTPLATSLAYIMFTSGSTGRPKGVMVEHRGIVRLSKNTSYLYRGDDAPTTAHIASLAFDASTWEIYSTLLNGGTLVCVDSMALLDHQAVEKIFVEEQIRSSLITPALLKQYLAECPQAIAQLEVLYMGGDRADLQDVRLAQTLVRDGRIINLYGPTENSVVSTYYCVTSREDAYVNGVPIGRSISHSGAYVMDRDMRCVPDGVIGELVVTGDGLARGYLDPRQDVYRFVKVDLNGKRLRAYRTGDYVRRRPIDGELEFLGRIDAQVKIRGQRVELGEIEFVLRSHESVSDAVVVVQEAESDREGQLAAFVTLRKGDMQDQNAQPGDDEKEEQLGMWEELFEMDTYAAIDNVQASIGRDFLGWTSMYDGTDIDKGEMNEWLDDTLQSINNYCGKPRHVLELGSGSGMVLFNLQAECLESYVGVEPSQRAVDFILKSAQSMPKLAGKVRMHRGMAADVSRLSESLSPELVIVNSVAQYFPSLEYLSQLVEDLLNLGGVKTLYFGDMRSYALYKQFRVTKALHEAGALTERDRPERGAIQRRIADIEQGELEFLVDPAFFTGLVDRFPDRVEHVQVLPKTMKATNELSCYRYAAIVHVKNPEHGASIRTIRNVEQDTWIDFMDRCLDAESLSQLLRHGAASKVVAISNIPHNKTILERHIIDSFSSESQDDYDWYSSSWKKATASSALSAIELVAIAKETGYRVDISWARQYSQYGGLDAVFYQSENRETFRFPFDHKDRPFHQLSSQPLQQQMKRKVREQLDKLLSAQLPVYMVPRELTILDSMPMNDSGKVDRQRLAATAQKRVARAALVQPTTQAEILMQKIWAQVLGIDASTISVDDGFFQIGGDSLAAMKVVSLARESASLTLTVADIFRCPTLRDVSRQAAPSDDTAVGSTITHTDLTGPVIQSYAQGRLWFLEQLHPGLTWYHMPWAMRLRGNLHTEALNAAILALENRHESLRTVFSTRDGVSTAEVQPVHKGLEVVRVQDEEDAMRALVKHQSTPFTLETEPGWRVAVYQFSNTDSILSIVMHHIISDGWSVGILARELTLFYTAALRNEDPLSQVKPLPIQYRDYALWGRSQMEEQERQLSYWVTELETSQPAEFPCDKIRPATLSGRAEARGLQVDGQLYHALQKYCRESDVTPFTVLLAAFRAAHYRLTGQGDATIGSPNANRDRWEVKDIIGFFVNMQCIRIRVEEDSFTDLVRQVHTKVTESFANQDVPFERIVGKLHRDRDLSRHPIVQLVFVVHSAASSELEEFNLQGIEAETIPELPTTRFDLEFHFFQERDSFRGEILYSKDLYEPETIDNMISVFRNILTFSLKEPTKSIASVPLLTPSNYAELVNKKLIDMNVTNYARDSSIVDVFQQQVALHPNRIAVKEPNSTVQMTYAELDQASDTLARWLLSLQLLPETLVGVLSSRSCQAVMTYLGILKANLAYLPLDVKLPAARIETILSSVGAQHITVLLGTGVQPLSLSIDNVECISISDALASPSKGDAAGSEWLASHQPSTATSLAYVMFTSGSTGRPKGVMVEHRGIVRLAKQSTILQQNDSGMPVITAHISNLAFDASTWEIYVTLLNGGTLVCIDAMSVLDYRSLEKIFVDEAVQSMLITPALLKEYLSECPDAIGLLTTIYIGGDRLDTKDVMVAQELVQGRVINLYGPTENSVVSTFYCLSSEESFVQGVPIGGAIDNSGAYVMDKQQQLLPLGAVGELVVTGDGLARGYLDPVQNAGRFVSLTFGGHEKVRGYRTGDQVRRRPKDGHLEFLGRIDAQVKIRGQRVELGEIEHVLRGHQSVKDAVAVLQQQHDDVRDAQLVSFVTLRKDNAEQPDEPSVQAGDDEKKQQLGMWENLFETDTYAAIDDIQNETLGRDFVGWTSMYDGSDIDNAEMNEWLEDTLDTIYRHSQPRNVLELGSGSGMILFNLKEGLQSYVGIEPSQRAVDFLAKTAQSIPHLAGRVQMYKGMAADIGNIGRDVDLSPNVAIINSVAQYFPSVEYLTKVVEDLLQLSGIETIYFGDVRSYAMYGEFRATKALFTAGDRPDKEDIRRRMTDIQQGELEFLVNPSFFTAMQARFPDVIENVEILPKRMKAINELSCYRYAAVIHVKHLSDRLQQLQVVKTEEWIDFDENLDQQSLTQLLKERKAVVAVQNIPHSKTILEKYVVDALETSVDDNQVNWLSFCQSNAKSCPALSAIDLMDLGQKTGRRVQISWARQYSQRGGFDAIFYLPREEQGEVRFSFPIDHDVPVHLLSNKPLEQQMKRKVRDQLNDMLRAQLPAYMVPRELTILEKMPVNENGKVDRRALAATVRKRHEAQGVVLQPTTEAELQMQKIWSNVLGLDPTSIGLDDGFFQLGGDSLAAMRVAGEAGKIGITLTVADIFRRPILRDMASPNADKKSSESEPRVIVDLIDADTKADLLREIDSHGYGITSADISDIVPATSSQEKVITIGTKSGQVANYFHLDFATDIDIARFRSSCALILDKFPILRTWFLRLGGRLWQVVPRKMIPPLRTRDVTENLDEAWEAFCREDMPKVSPDQPPIAFTLLRHETQGTRLVLRISHAQYDGVSLPRIFQSLFDAYHDRPVIPGPVFSEFLSYAFQRRQQSILYWEEVLRGAPVSSLQPPPRQENDLQGLEREAIVENREVDLPRLPKGITSATVVATAWAMLLSHLSGQDDIVYGRVVAGRNSGIRGIEQVVGPCLNIVPVRVKLSQSQRYSELLSSVQEQFLTIGESDSLDTGDILQQCTSWPAGTEFQSVIQHQNIDEHPEIQLSTTSSRVQFFVNWSNVPSSLFLMSYPHGNGLRFSLHANTHVISIEAAKGLLDGLCDMIRSLDC